MEQKFPRPLIIGMSSELAHHHFFHTSLAKAKYTASSYSRGILQLSISRQQITSKLSSVKQQSFILLTNLPFGQGSVGTIHLCSTKISGEQFDQDRRIYFQYGWQIPLCDTLRSRLVSLQYWWLGLNSKNPKRQEVAASGFLRCGPETATAPLLSYPSQAVTTQIQEEGTQTYLSRGGMSNNLGAMF